MPKKSMPNIVRRKITSLEFKELLKDAIEEPIGVKKGKKFEFFFENFMAHQEGFVFVSRHPRSKVGEIDYLYRNELFGHPLWEKFRYLFIECKNWKEHISSEKMNDFIKLLEAKNPFNCCGVYLTTSYFSPQAFTSMRDARLKSDLMIVPIEGKDLHGLIDKGFKILMQEKCDEILAKG